MELSEYRRRCTRRQWHQPGLSAHVKGLAASAVSRVKVSCAGARHTGSRSAPVRWVHSEGPDQAGVCGCYSPFLKCRAQASARIHRPSARFALIVCFSHPELVTEEEWIDLGRSRRYSIAASPFGWMNRALGVNLSLPCVRGPLGTISGGDTCG